MAYSCVDSLGSKLTPATGHIRKGKFRLAGSKENVPLQPLLTTLATLTGSECVWLVRLEHLPAIDEKVNGCEQCCFDVHS